MKHTTRHWQLTLLIFLTCSWAFAQQDSTYFVTHNTVFHGRVYLIQKYNALHYENTRQDRNVSYLPHTIPGIGVGFSYDWITVNFSYGLRLNGKEQEKGDTKYLDLQVHSYAKKFILDIFGQQYKGLYVVGEGDANGNYNRPDVQSRLLGGSFQYVLNNKRFSFRSSFLQTDWQKKSAGSLLVGLESYWGRVRSDSTLLPNSATLASTDATPREDYFFQAGPTLGYAYTVVIKKHFFITGSLAESFNFGVRSRSYESGKASVSGLNTNPSYRLIAGYNAENWGMSIFYVNNRVNVAGKLDDYKLAMSSGTFRINYVHRFTPKGKFKSLLSKVNFKKNSNGE